MKISDKRKYTVGFGILSWKAHKTIIATLNNYKSNDFFSIFDQSNIFFQEISQTDVKIANDTGINYTGIKENVGIQGGFRNAVESLNTDYVLIAENDCPLIVDRSEALKQIQIACDLIESGQIDMMRFRSRWNTGEQFCDVEKYSRYHQLDINKKFISEKDLRESWLFRRIFRPFKAKRLIGRSVYVEKFPEKKYPKYIKRLIVKGEENREVFAIDSAVINWTNQTTLIKKDLILKLLDFADANPKKRTVNGMQDFEKNLNHRWWKKQHFKVGVCDGIFTHKRLDR